MEELMKIFIFVICWSHIVPSRYDIQHSCQSDLFTPECDKGQILVIQRATLANTHCGYNILEDDKCLTDVFAYVNMICTGHMNCSIDVRNLEEQEESSCPGDRKRYLRMSFQCLTKSKAVASSRRDLEKEREATNGFSIKVLEFLFIVSAILIIGAILILCCSAFCLSRMKRKHERKMQLLTATSLTASVSTDNLCYGCNPRYASSRPQPHEHYDPRYYLPNLPMAGPHNPPEITPSYSIDHSRCHTLPSKYGRKKGYQLDPTMQRRYRPDQPSTSRGQGPSQGYYTLGHGQRHYGPALPTVTEFLPPPYTPMGRNAIPLNEMPRGGSDPYFNTMGRTSSFQSVRSKSCETNLDNMINEAACRYPEEEMSKPRSCDDNLDKSKYYYEEEEEDASKQYYQLDPDYMKI